MFPTLKSVNPLNISFPGISTPISISGIISSKRSESSFDESETTIFAFKFLLKASNLQVQIPLFVLKSRDSNPFTKKQYS